MLKKEMYLKIFSKHQTSIHLIFVPHLQFGGHSIPSSDATKDNTLSEGISSETEHTHTKREMLENQIVKENHGRHHDRSAQKKSLHLLLFSQNMNPNHTDFPHVVHQLPLQQRRDQV